MKSVKGQSGLDLLMSYGWIIIVGIVAVIIISQMGLFSETVVPCSKTKMAFSQIEPVDWAVYRDNNIVVLRIENVAGDPMEVNRVKASLGDVLCENQVYAFLEPGAEGYLVVNCSQDPSIPGMFRTGSCFTAEVSLSYLNRVTNNAYESRGRLSGPVEEGLVSTTTSTTTTTTTSSSTTTSSTSTSTSMSTTTTLDEPPNVALNYPPDGHNIIIP